VLIYFEAFDYTAWPRIYVYKYIALSVCVMY